jgi:hypothetical protein
MSPDTQELLKHRTAMWRGAVEQELQALIQEASRIRKEIDTAKTSVKKEYFKKKFKKLTTQVMQMLTALERVKAQQAEVERAAAEDQAQVEVPSAETVPA